MDARLREVGARVPGLERDQRTAIELAVLAAAAGAAIRLDQVDHLRAGHPLKRAVIDVDRQRGAAARTRHAAPTRDPDEDRNGGHREGDGEVAAYEHAAAP